MAPRPDDKPAQVDEGTFADLAVDRDAEVPIGVQLAWTLRSRIAEGQLAPGTRLPGLRELADASGVNVNTVRAVYQRLEREGLIDSQQGSGTFVSATPSRPSVATIAASAAREAMETGVDPREVAAALYVSADAPVVRSGAAAQRRRLLRAQITALERTLGELEATHPGLAPAPGTSRTGSGPALLSAEELEQVRAALVRRLAVTQASIDERLAAEAAEQEPAPVRVRAPAKAKVKAQAKAPKGEPKLAGPRRGAGRPAPAAGAT